MSPSEEQTATAPEVAPLRDASTVVLVRDGDQLAGDVVVRRLDVVRGIRIHHDGDVRASGDLLRHIRGGGLGDQGAPKGMNEGAEISYGAAEGWVVH